MMYINYILLLSTLNKLIIITIMIILVIIIIIIIIMMMIIIIIVIIITIKNPNKNYVIEVIYQLKEKYLYLHTIEKQGLSK